MPTAFVDTSCLSRVALKEPGHEHMSELLWRFDVWKASPLLYAELRSVCKREKAEGEGYDLLKRIEWVEIPGPLLAEIEEGLGAGYLRGPDLWHVACALYARTEEPELTFLTLDLAQARVARALKFRVLPEGAGTFGVKERRARYAAMPVRGRRRDARLVVGAAATRRGNGTHSRVPPRMPGMRGKAPRV
jgi:predicted nucleic acid-binding protein